LTFRRAALRRQVLVEGDIEIEFDGAAPPARPPGAEGARWDAGARRWRAVVPIAPLAASTHGYPVASSPPGAPLG
jgi:hypothetical protein